MKSCAIINTSTVWPYRDYVRKSEETTKSQIYLNKLWIPDVLIDIIKDYLYIGVEEVLRKYHRSAINASICHLTCDSYHYVDVFGRRRVTVWSIMGKPDVKLLQSMCITCGEKWDSHPNLNGCCALEWDSEDGTLELDVENIAETGDNSNYNDIDEESWGGGDYNPYNRYDDSSDDDDDDE